MDIFAMGPIRQGNPDGVNDHTCCPVAKGVRDYFSHDIERAVDIRIQAAPRTRAEEPARDTLPCIDLVFAYRFQVEEAALGGVALLAHDDAHAHQLRLVVQQLNEPRMRHEDEVLVGPFPESVACFQPSFLPITSVAIRCCTSRSTMRYLATCR
jgi:hypothetical protein